MGGREVVEGEQGVELEMFQAEADRRGNQGRAQVGPVAPSRWRDRPAVGGRSVMLGRSLARRLVVGMAVISVLSGCSSGAAPSLPPSPATTMTPTPSPAPTPGSAASASPTSAGATTPTLASAAVASPSPTLVCEPP